MRRIQGMFLAAALLGCDVFSPEAGPLSVTVRVASPEIVRRTPVGVTVVAHNRSQETQYVASFCVRNFQVAHAIGVELQLPGLICLAVAPNVGVIAPGDSLVLHDSWDGTVAGPDGLSALAPPGNYRISGRVLVPSGTPGKPTEFLSSAVPVILR